MDGVDLNIKGWCVSIVHINPTDFGLLPLAATEAFQLAIEQMGVNDFFDRSGKTGQPKPLCGRGCCSVTSGLP